MEIRVYRQNDEGLGLPPCQYNRQSDQSRVCNLKVIFFFSNKIYVVGAQKSRLKETVLLSTQNICLQ